MTKKQAPTHLNADTRRWWASVVETYQLDPHHLKLLSLCGESWDRCEQARKAIRKHGLVFTDRLGTPRARPEVAIERDARLAFVRCLRELDLDIEPPKAAGRPPGR